MCNINIIIEITIHHYYSRVWLASSYQKRNHQKKHIDKSKVKAQARDLSRINGAFEKEELA